MSERGGHLYEDSVRKQFGKRAESFENSANWITDKNLIQTYIEAAPVGVGRGLDLCCGTGVLGRAFVKHDWEMTGLDITAEMVALASKFMTTIVGRAEELPFEDASFDLVVLRQALFLLEHKKALREIRRVLKKGGVFIFGQTVPFSEIDAPWLEKIHVAKQREMKKFYSASDLESELSNGGFLVKRRIFLSVRESITRWMDMAPELLLSKREEICSMVRNAPDEYRRERNVEVIDGEILENWNWVVFQMT